MNNTLIEDGLKEMDALLTRSEVGRLALYDGKYPYIIPVNFLYHNQMIIFHCGWKGKKLDVVMKNPNCCFEVDEYMGKVSYHHGSKCHLDYDSVLAFGKVHIEDKEEEKIRLLQLFSDKYEYEKRYLKPLSKGPLKLTKASCNCVVINVEELTGRRERTTSEGKREKIMWHHKF